MTNSENATRTAEESDQPVTIESLQELLREARWYVFHAEVPHQGAYDDQQAMLKKIDDAAPPPPPPHPYVFERCEKDADCNLGKGHTGDCDDIPF